MDFDKDNFEEDNELAPLEEEEAGDVDEVAGVEIDEIVVGDETEDESEVPKRASSGPKRGSAGSASRPATRKAAAARRAARRKLPLVKQKLRQEIGEEEIRQLAKKGRCEKSAKKSSRGSKKKKR